MSLPNNEFISSTGDKVEAFHLSSLLDCYQNTTTLEAHNLFG